MAKTAPKQYPVKSANSVCLDQAEHRAAQSEQPPVLEPAIAGQGESMLLPALVRQATANFASALCDGQMDQFNSGVDDQFVAKRAETARHVNILAMG